MAAGSVEERRIERGHNEIVMHATTEQPPGQHHNGSLRRRHPATRYWYLALVLLMATAVVVGFWPTYFAPLLAGSLRLRPMVEVHAVVFLGWMVFVVAQTSLVSVRRVNLHRTLGLLGVAYAALIVVVGLLVTADQFAADMALGDIRRAHSRILVPIVDILMFAGFFGAAFAYRKKPEVHKRLMIVTVIITAGPGIARIPFLTTIPQIVAAACAPFLLGMAFDGVTRRRVHPVYVIGLATFLASMVRAPLRSSEAWINLSMRVHGLFL